MLVTRVVAPFGKPVLKRLTLVWLALVVGLSFAMTSAMHPASAAASEPVSIQANADTTAYRIATVENPGAATTLSARRYRSQVLIRFDLTNLLQRPVEKLELGLTVLSGDASTLRMVRSESNWDELTVTWATRPPVDPSTLTAVQTAGSGAIAVDLTAFFPQGIVDRDSLSLRVRSLSTTAVRMAARESSSGGPALTLIEASDASGGTTAARPSTPLRFYTPNIIARGDNANPARDTTAAQMDALFSNESDMARLLDSVDVYSFFGASLGRGDPAYDAMVRRAIPILASHGVELGLEVGGPLGYAPPVVSAADRGGQNGEKSALFDLQRRVYRIEALGGSVKYLMLDGALRRTISNGMNKLPHAAFLTVGLARTSNALTFRARAAGPAGNSISIEYAAAGAGSPLSVTVSGTNVTVSLATDTVGRSTSTAAAVKSAVETSAAASALVGVSHLAGSSGSGLVSAVPMTPLAYGDNGLNMTIAESTAEVVAYMRTINAARPDIRFVLIEDVVLWPYDGVAGYASVPYPNGQRPDFKNTWNELVRQLTSARLMRLLIGMHNDVSVEYLDRQVPSINRNADDWYGRIFKQQAQVEASGVQFAQHFNSLYGGNPLLSSLASPSYFQSQVLHHVEATERYRLENRPDVKRSGHFAIDAFMYEPRVITPWTNDLSTDSTYLKALDRYLSGASQPQGVVVMLRPDEFQQPAA